MTPLLSAHQLNSYYGEQHAVKQVDLDIQQGECLGLLGPNGAGKSTTLEILEGIRKPNSGTVKFKGEILNQAYKKCIGIQFQATALPDYLTVRDCLTLFASFYSHPTPVEDLIEQCQLAEFIDKLHFHLSGGQRQRLLLALSLINDPELLFLDEPTTGLDPNARMAFWAVLRNIKRQGKTIVITTHYMEEAEQLCDRIAIMNHGEIITEHKPESLLEQHFFNHIITVPSSGDYPDTHNEAIRTRQQGGQLVLECNDAEIGLTWLKNAQIPIKGLNIRAPNLEDLYLKLTGSTLLI